MDNNKATTLSVEELKKFEKMSDSWWNAQGDFKPLHELNPTRLEYIISTIKNFFGVTSILELDILDIGCGGGLICEPLARLGAKVTGIDASEVNINIAKAHAMGEDLEINYYDALVENFSENNQKFSVILALEILEHVENIDFFIEHCTKLLKKGGLIIFSTINQTIKSYLESIIAAEYILKWVPKGTHDWQKFVKPSELNHYASKYGLSLYDMMGLSYDIILKKWKLTHQVDNNYFCSFTI